MPPLLPRLFPSEVATEEARLSDALDALLDEEAQQSADYGDKRRAEFRGGRHCARRALSRLGASPSAILNEKTRAPRWPHGFVGSISHTGAPPDGYCGAAVARASDIRAIGLDAELDEPLYENLWERTLRKRERAWVEAHAESERGSAAKLLFSAKECLYKCQYPLTGQYLGFQDVEILVLPVKGNGSPAPGGVHMVPAGTIGRFQGVFLKPAGDDFQPGDSIEGAYVRDDGLVVTAIVLRAR